MHALKFSPCADMYAEFAFGNHLESSKGDPIDLPLPVESSGGKKYFVSELVVCFVNTLQCRQ